MSAESIVYNILTNTSAITNVVAVSHMYPYWPTDPPVEGNFLVYVRTDTGQLDNPLTGTNNLQRNEITIHLFMTYLDQARSLADTIKATLHGYHSGTTQGIFIFREVTEQPNQLTPLVPEISQTYNVYCP